MSGSVTIKEKIEQWLEQQKEPFTVQEVQEAIRQQDRRGHLSTPRITNYLRSMGAKKQENHWTPPQIILFPNVKAAEINSQKSQKKK